jgi:hypothetical protein
MQSSRKRSVVEVPWDQERDLLRFGKAAGLPLHR